ncbi:hypothetical protein [Streptococcus anginosus]
MKKKKFIIPILSTLLIAPAILAHQVSADAVDPAGFNSTCRASRSS